MLEQERLKYRFMTKVDVTENCWFWNGAKLPNGYPVMVFEGRNRSAGWVALTIFDKRPPEGSEIRRTCGGGKTCVNPDHQVSLATPSDRFWFWTRISDGCWEWQGAKTKGYGKIGIEGRKGSDVLAHRFSWELTNGPVTDPDLCVLHSCDNPSCVRPDHLFLGTRTKNAEDKVRKNRQQKGERVKNSKVNEQTVLQIRERYDSREVITTRTTWGDPNSITALASEFGIHPTTVFDIVHRKTWKHI